jgi:hypothetical protein
MSFRLVYRHGSFRKVEQVSSVAAGLDLALDLKRHWQHCREFCVYDSFNNPVLSEYQIQAEFERRRIGQPRASLQNTRTEPVFGRASAKLVS